MNLIEQTINQLSKLPGLGKKSASRIAYYLLKAETAKVEALTRAITSLKTNLKTCDICGNFSESNPCYICTDTQRDHSLICIIEEAKDIPTIESSKAYNGLYHVLNGVISPINGVGPKDLRIQELVQRIKNNDIKEVILATNPTVEGDTTAIYLAKILKGYNIIISRLALGLPVGGDLEYADKLTLSQALKGRNSI